MWQHQYWNKNRWMLYYNRAKAKNLNFCINVAALLLEGKALGATAEAKKQY
jgi:hypothetical protein